MIDKNRGYNHSMLRLKYARDYFSALSKIQSKQINGYSNGEYELTKEENDALRYYINDCEVSFEKEHKSR